mmetsp:Transcript_64153/g.126756  ORF Transcript_64153/g.126756 Transcript_64153/m.126756 type:complete len:219 (-) Transcript_64153:578-1234(-)
MRRTRTRRMRRTRTRGRLPLVARFALTSSSCSSGGIKQWLPRPHPHLALMARCTSAISSWWHLIDTALALPLSPKIKARASLQRSTLSLAGAFAQPTHDAPLPPLAAHPPGIPLLACSVPLHMPKSKPPAATPSLSPASESVDGSSRRGARRRRRSGARQLDGGSAAQLHRQTTIQQRGLRTRNASALRFMTLSHGLRRRRNSRRSCVLLARLLASPS